MESGNVLVSLLEPEAPVSVSDSVEVWGSVIVAVEPAV